MLRRSLFRTIRRTLARYLAILAIIALGVGFFAGLRITEKAMLATAGEYIQELKLYDFRLLSTLGLTEEDVEAFDALDGVESAQGGYSVDALCLVEDGEEAAFHVHALLSQVNGLDVVSGRLPETADECVLDALHAGEDMLGCTVTLAEENDPDTVDMFARREYTVVGLVNAVTYLNFERGSTSLAGGTASGFLYLLPEAFSGEYYTEIYLALPDAGEIYSSEYQAALDGVRGEVEDLLDRRAQLRYETLRSDAQAEIDDARDQLAEEEETLADAQEEIDAGWETYYGEEDDVQSALSSNQARLDGFRAQLDQGWGELNAAREDPVGAIPEVADQVAAMEEILAGLEAKRKELSDSVQGLQAELAALDEQELAMDLEQEAIDARQEEYEEDCRRTADELAAMEAALDESDPEYEQKLAAYQAAVKEQNDRLSDLERGIKEDQADLDSRRAELEARRLELSGMLTTLEGQLALQQLQVDGYRKAMEDFLADPLAALPELSQKLDETQAALEAREAEYAQGQAEYARARKEAQEGLDQARQELLDAQAEVDEAQPQLEEARDEIRQAQEELGDLKPATVYALDRSSNVGYASLENDTAIVSGVSRVFPLFFFLVAALVCITTMTRMVGEQRTENGVLKALGYGEWAVTGQYLAYAGSASAVGCVLGFLLGSRYMPMALWQVYRIMYSVNRPIQFVLDWKLFFLCSALYLFCALGATWLVCRRDLRESAAQLMRPKAPSAGRRVLLERVGFVWNRLPFLHKVSIRNILRYQKRMIMMILGVGGCTALLLAGFGVRDTIQPVVTRQYQEIDLYDAAVSFLEPVEEEGREAFLRKAENTVEEAAFLHTESADAMIGSVSREINLVVFQEPMDGFVDLHRGEMSLAWPEPGQAVVNYRFAQANGLSVGDSFQLSAAELPAVTVTVSGIFDNYIYDYVYVSADTFRLAGGEPEWNTAYVNFPDGADAHQAGAQLLGTDNVANVSLSADMITRISSMLDSLNYIVLIVLVCAGALAFIVQYNLTNIAIIERTREIATLKVLGFYRKEQNEYIFRENMMLTVLSAICGIPMGMALLRYVMDQIKISTIYFGYRLAPQSYLWAVVLTIGFTVIVDGVLVGKLRKINMAEALKAIE